VQRRGEGHKVGGVRGSQEGREAPRMTSREVDGAAEASGSGRVRGTGFAVGGSEEAPCSG
jgi:hypothetical protein